MPFLTLKKFFGSEPAPTLDNHRELMVVFGYDSKTMGICSLKIKLSLFALSKKYSASRREKQPPPEKKFSRPQLNISLHTACSPVP